MVNRKKLVEPILYLVLIISLLAPRLPGLGSYVTLDEPYWLSMGANFYYALGQREFQNTVYEYQPAVTTMWIITAAMLMYFPQYRGFGQGYLDYNKGLLDGFLIEHGRHPLELLEISRVIQVVVVAVLFLVLYYLLKRFVNKFVAAFAILFASLDPFFLSQSRMLDHEAMLSLFVMISLLALAIYFSLDKRFGFLLLSGVAAGLAQLTKSSAIAMLVPVGILFLAQVYQQRAHGWWKSLLDNAKIFFIWLGILIAAYFIFWPGMWVAPQKMLYEVYGNAFSYAFQGGRLAVTGELESSQFSVELNLAGILSLTEMLLRRTTWLTWIGILLGFALPFSRDMEWDGARRWLFALCWATAAAFIIMFGIAQGRNSPHYILCSYLALNILAGLGWFYFAQRISSRVTIQYSALVALLLIQWVASLPFYPYYYTYENPLSKNTRNAAAPLFPYGEGLELAGQYLAGLPNAKNSTALVYFSRGCFSYFYPGTTNGFKPYYVDGLHAKDLMREVTSADYLIVYYALQSRLPKYEGYIEALSGAQPLHEVWLDGRKYVVIYQVNQIPESVLNALANLPPIEPIE